jgi:hypothetical protein
MTALEPLPPRAACCICPPDCGEDCDGDVCIDARCGWCLEGCPAPAGVPCCFDERQGSA